MIRMAYDPFGAADKYDLYSWAGLLGVYGYQELAASVNVTGPQVRSQIKRRGFACLFQYGEPVVLVPHGAQMPRAAREWISSEILAGK